MVGNTSVPHAVVADAQITQARTKKLLFLNALRAALIGAAAGYSDYQCALAMLQPVNCSEQQMGWYFAFSCE
jgi:hypothetical protein